MDRFLIAPLASGLQTDLKPFLIPDDAFAELTNAYVWRGRVRKRFGSLLTGTGAPTALTAPFFSRLGIPLAGGAAVGITDGAGNATGTVPGSSFAKGQFFVIGSAVYTTITTGATQTMLKSVATTTATFSTTNGVYNFVGAPALTQIYYYTAQPVMGLANYEAGAINNQPSFAFDPQFAYTFAGGRWIRNGTPVWHGDDTDFFWTTNYDGISADKTVMFVTNFHPNTGGTGLVTDDPIWGYNGSTWSPFSYSPSATINPTNTQPYTVTRATAVTGAIALSYVQTARIILPFKDRLVLLNTIENNASGATAFDTGSPTTSGITPTNYLTSTNTAYVNRCRFSFNGSPFARNAWLEPNQVFKPDTGAALLNAGGGGYVDAPTEEEIVSAQFIKDRLIVYFEQSTWELAYTGNQELPFVWQKINTELGSESTFSSVPFDKVILTVSNTGIHACNGANVERIDEKIPMEVFKIRNKFEGVGAVAGIRDYDTEMVYWTFPSSNVLDTAIFPNRIFVFNYKTGSWAFNEDCITAFGYFEQQEDLIWSNATLTWEQYGQQTWSSGVTQSKHRQVLAGNQQGFVFIVAPDISANATVMMITDMSIFGDNVLLEVSNHTLQVGEYVEISNATITTTRPGVTSIFQVVSVNSKDLVEIGFEGYVTIVAAAYLGGGTIRRVSNLNIVSKQWNPYLEQGVNFHLAKIDFAVMKTSLGEVTVDYFPSSTQLSMLDAGLLTDSNMGTGVLETRPYDLTLAPLEQEQDRLWHAIYFQTDGECVQIKISMSEEQIIQPFIAFEFFELEGMVLHCQKTASRLQ